MLLLIYWGIKQKFMKLNLKTFGKVVDRVQKTHYSYTITGADDLENPTLIEAKCEDNNGKVKTSTFTNTRFAELLEAGKIVNFNAEKGTFDLKLEYTQRSIVAIEA